MDLYFPTPIRVSSTQWSIADNAGRFVSPLTGQQSVVARPGDKWTASVVLNNQDNSGAPAAAALNAFVLAMRGGINSVLMRDQSYTKRGSFASTELLSNPRFNGTTGYTAGSEMSFSVADRVGRVTRTAVSVTGSPEDQVARTFIYGSGTTVSGAAYVARALVVKGKGYTPHTGFLSVRAGTSADGSELGTTAWDSFGLLTHTFVATGTTTYVGVRDADPTGVAVGDYVSIPFMSLSRCARVNGASQSGNALLVKNLPTAGTSPDAGVAGLLLPGDRIQIGDEYKVVTAVVNSAADGTGYIEFAPALRESPADNDPVIIHEPMSRFMFASESAGWSSRPGVFTDSTLEFVEDMRGGLGALVGQAGPAIPSVRDVNWLEITYDRTQAEISAGVTPTNYAYEPGVIDRYGTNTTPGTTDMTTAFDAACKSTATVRGIPGSTYLVTGVTATTARQLFDLTGCEFKLANSTNAIILTLSGAGSVVRGGRFNGNKANQSGTGANQYNHAAVRINADYCIVEEIESYDSFGIGVKGTSCNYATIRNNRILDPEIYGVYVEGTTTNHYGNEILDNYIDTQSVAGASGIYLTGQNSPFTNKQYLWKIRGNTCRGSTSSPTGVGITSRAVDGVIGENLTTGYTIGISGDIATRTTITGNRCEGAAGSSGYGIEVIGGYCSVVGNVIKGGTYGIVIAPAAAAGPNILLSGNVIDDPSSRCIYVNAATQAVQFLNINGNTFVFTGSGTNRRQIYLAGDCKYSTISGNNFNGPGSGISGSRGIYLDTVVSHVSILGNRFNGFERPVSLYHASAVAYTNISFIGNDCSRDNASDSLWLALEGSATYGAGIVQAWNVTSSGAGLIYFDRQNSVLMNMRAGTPESALTAGVGSLVMRSDGGAATCLYVKESGTGNTGWVAK